MYSIVILLIAVSVVLVGILAFRMHAFLALLMAALVVALLTPRTTLEAYAQQRIDQHEWTPKKAAKFVDSTAAERVAEPFGNTVASIGILIAMASIIGKCLLDSGAADKIVRSTLRLVGQSRAPLAFLGSGFVLGIPVFFDTVFYLMIPLGKALRLRTGANYLLYILTIVAGATMAHSLVPPTPGPLYVADKLHVDLLAMILGGCVVGSFASVNGYLFALWANRRWEIPLRESAEASLADLENLSRREDRDLPPLWLSLTPILLPVVLIAVATVFERYTHGLAPEEIPLWAQTAGPAITTLGNKNLALVLSGALALLMLAWQKRTSGRELTAAVQMALAGGGVIILITAAGGAFGEAVTQSGIPDQVARLKELVSPLFILPIAFLVTMLVRTAQGSATVAMITAVGIVERFAVPGELPFHPVYLALAIGCGSKPIMWMADSGFWVICKMSGMTEAEGLKTVSPMSVVMGVSGLLATMIGAKLFPWV